MEEHERRERGLLLGAAVLLYAALALDGRLYWHDVRYLYATAHYDLVELFAGVWNPQYGETLDAAATGAFYLVKGSLLLALEALWRVRPPDTGGLDLAVALSLLCTALSGPSLAAVLARALPRGGASAWLPVGAAALLLVSPTLPWLGGKLLGEVLALPLELAALALALAAARAARGRAVALGLVSASLHWSAVCARPNVGVLAAGFFAAAAIATPACCGGRRRALGLALAALAIQAAAHAVVFWMTGVGWTGFIHYFMEFASGSRSPIVSILGTLAATGALLPLAALGALTPERPARRLLLWWLALTALPTLAVVSLYQVEARYLIAPLVPLAGLAALGALRLLGSGGRIRLAALAAGVVAIDALALSVLPYEIDRRRLDELLAAPELAAPGASLLVPWAYSDFHYLVTVAPERPVYFVHVPRVDGRLRPYTEEWRERIAHWYGPRVVLDEGALVPLLERGPVYALAWGVHPPLELWSRRLRAVGLPGLADRVRALGGAEHGDQTWIADAPGLRRRGVREAGLYRLERVTRAPPSRSDS